jgi:hypothetical protein
MKHFLILILALLLISSSGITQPCSGGPGITCSDKKVVSSAVLQPTNLEVVSSNATTMVIKWTGNSNQEYVANAILNSTDTVAATNITSDGNNNYTATIPVVAGNKYTISVQARATVGTCPFYSYPQLLVLQYPIPASSQGSTVSFSGKVMLQGPYNTSTRKMNNDLNTLGILQTNAATQPYNTAGFNYKGTEHVADGFFAAHPDIVDWVLLELRDPNAPTSVIAQRAAFVKQDGTVTDIDGSSNAITFNNVAAGNYYVLVKHRNHLGIRTATPVDFSSGTGNYDFTTANFRSFKNQSYTSTVQMGTVWAMRGGYTNFNSLVKYSGPGNDQNQILNNKLGGSIALILDNVYAREDVNMNGNIKWSGPNNDQNFLLNVSLGGSISALFIEQL